MTTSHRAVWTAYATRLPSMPIAVILPFVRICRSASDELPLDGRERHELQRHAGRRDAQRFEGEAVLVDDAVAADDRSVTCARDPEYRDAAVRDPQCVEGVPLGRRQDGDPSVEGDPRRPVDQGPGGDAATRRSIDHVQPIGPVDPVGCEHDPHQAVAPRRDQVLARRAGAARARSPAGDRGGRTGRSPRSSSERRLRTASSGPRRGRCLPRRTCSRSPAPSPSTNACRGDRDGMAARHPWRRRSPRWREQRPRPCPACAAGAPWRRAYNQVDLLSTRASCPSWTTPKRSSRLGVCTPRERWQRSG